jgi:hypothetical protein
MGNLRKSGVEFDTRQKPWYTRARDTHERYWTAPFSGCPGDGERLRPQGFYPAPEK